MFTKHVINCCFSQWFQSFSHISIESKRVKLSDDFIQYLLSDVFVLPKSCHRSDGCVEEWSEDTDDDSTTAEDNVFEFPDIERQMNEVIEAFGHVFPKLNWSSCEDSKWISASGTRCRTPEDIYLLLKSSDRVVHDLTQPFKHCVDFNETNVPQVDYELVLKKWIDINPSMEFRCFVANNGLVAISQRDVRSYYDHIRQQKEQIVEDIQSFFDTHLRHKFHDNCFVFDVYRPSRGRVVLVDVNPFGLFTDSLLFDWDELNGHQNNSTSQEAPEFRYLTGETGVQPQSYTMNSMPIEVNYGYNINDIINGKNIE